MSRVFLLSVLCAAGLSFLLVPYGRKKLTAFIHMEAHPLNLSIFRIVLFLALLLHSLALNPLWFNQIPHELLGPPWGLKWLDAYLPMDQNVLRILYVSYLFFCVTGMLGFFSRTSAFCVTLLGLIVIGLPQMYAKLNHEHHLLWFSALLACSPSADVFSIDAVWQAFGRADRGTIEPPGKSTRYGRPFVFILLLFGIIYFFPGFWKIWRSGSEWIFTDNLVHHIYWKWVEYPDWLPFVRIDHNLYFMRFLAFATIAFELSFIFLLFFPKLRTWQGLAGLAFHSGTTWFMQIPFWQLQMCYVVFFDWNRIFGTIGNRLFREPMYLFYDGNCKLCRRTIAAIRVFDVFGRIEYINSLDPKALNLHRPAGVSGEALLKDMHASRGKKVWRGYKSYRALAWRVPIFWPIIPILYFFPVTFLGNWIYRRVADVRTCAVPGQSPKWEQGSIESENNTALFIVGCFLIAVNSWFGANDRHSFPFSVYPTFENIIDDGRISVRIEAQDANGVAIPMDTQEVREKLTSSRWYFLLSRALNIEEPEKQQTYLKALWRLLAANSSFSGRVHSVSFYKIFLTGNPDRRAQNPLRKERIFEWNQPQA